MNPIYNVIIESVDASGNGIARIDGKTVFIPDTLPTEEVKIEIYKKKKNFDFGRVVELISTSPERTTPECKNFGICGGCSLQHIAFDAQVYSKEKVLIDNLKHIGRVTATNILPALYGKPWEYRYRARLSVKYVEKKGGVLVGFREKGAPFVVDMNECRVLPKRISDLIPKLRTVLATLTIKDKIPQLEVACSDHTDVLVFRILENLSSEDIVILKNFADQVNSNNLSQQLQIWLQPGNEESIVQFYPHPDITKTLSYTLPEFNLTMPFLPSEFTQVNPFINQDMVSQAIKLLEIKPNDRILDLFCGIGNFTLAIASSASYVTGIEGSDKLIKRALENATLNNLHSRVDFITMDLFKVTSEYLAKLEKYDKWLIDPPRDGAFELVKAITLDIAPQLIVYVSCNPSTLARDADILVNTHGYKLMNAGVMNMFPHTSHIESIAVFTR
jgi:23S rRNA (uracil1939-C5)-methyltransferase